MRLWVGRIVVQRTPEIIERFPHPVGKKRFHAPIEIRIMGIDSRLAVIAEFNRMPVFFDLHAVSRKRHAFP